MGGRRSSSVNLVVRSMSVPIAELLRPTMSAVHDALREYVQDLSPGRFVRPDCELVPVVASA